MKTVFLKISIITSVALLILASFSVTSKADSNSEGLEAQIFQLKAQLAKANAEIEKMKPFAKRGAEMPVEMGKRKALLGSGEVLIIENVSRKTLPVKVTLISPTFGKTNTFDIVLDGAKIIPSKKEIGHQQGWAGAPGDIIEVESEGFTPVKKHF